MVHADGTPSQILSGRLNLAKRLYREKRIQFILVSGGKPRNKTGEEEEMKRWLMKEGVPSFRILVDPEGENTWLTALNTRRIMARKGYRHAVIVTSYYHLARTRLAFERAGVPVSGLAGATEGHGSFGEPFRVLREVPALYGYWLFKARR